MAAMWKRRLGLHIVEGSAFVGGQKIGTLAKIVYTLVLREQLLANARLGRFLRRSDRAA
jgi:hypothetical protein